MGYVNKLKKQITFRRIFNNEKTLVASSLAIGLGVVAGNAGHDAHASETTNVDKAELAQKALTNDQSLNEALFKKVLIILILITMVIHIILNLMVLLGVGVMNQQTMLRNLFNQANLK